jgi:hypothetical protein
MLLQVKIDLAASTPNTYDITYSFGTAPCTGNCYFASNDIKPTNSNSEWRYVLYNWNNNTTTTGATGGTFSATPAGLVIDATTGQIDLAASDA